MLHRLIRSSRLARLPQRSTLSVLSARRSIIMASPAASQRTIARDTPATPPFSIQELSKYTMQPVHAEYNAQREEQSMTLPNGNHISFAEYGDPNGIPCFLFHGSLGSRYDGEWFHEHGKKLGARIICPDRPGHGLSTLSKSRTLLDYPQDIQGLARHLDIDRYYCMGVSGGGPFAIACAYAIPREKLVRTGFIAGMAPWKYGNKDCTTIIKVTNFFLANFPTAMTYLIGKVMSLENLKDDDYMTKSYQSIVKYMPDPKDATRTTEEKEHERIAMINLLRQGYRQGPEGGMSDVKIYTNDWGFDLEDVQGEVKMFFGTKDANTPVRYGRGMVEELANATLKEYEGDTHNSIFDHFEEILEAILEGDERLSVTA